MAAPKTDADRADEQARKAEANALEMRNKVEAEDRSPAEKKAETAEQRADDARAKAEEVKRDESGDPVATTVAEAKAPFAHVDPETSVGDHHAQKFGNTPANPQLAPGMQDEPSVKLVMNTSDFPDPANPMVCYVHEGMVGDYLRAGWSRG